MKKMNKKKKLLIVIALLLLALCGFLIYINLKTEDAYVGSVINIKDSIENYSYHLDERDTEYFEEEFYLLKECLESEEIDFEVYATQISKLFVIDFYTLNNKISKYDVGGLEYLTADIEENFKLKAEDTLYKYVSTLDANNLPEVVSVVVTEIFEETIIFKDEEFDGYYVSVEIEYDVDLGYDTTGTFEIILSNESLEIVEFVGGN